MVLDPDVLEAFSDSTAVNSALRSLLVLHRCQRDNIAFETDAQKNAAPPNLSVRPRLESGLLRTPS